MTATQGDFSFNVEWLADTEQHYHGPRQRMRRRWRNASSKRPTSSTRNQRFDGSSTPTRTALPYFQKVKFYRFRDDASKTLLRFFILWCGDSVAVHERMFDDGAKITSATGWYPVVTGRRYFHHQNEIREATEGGLRKAMNRTAIERQPGLGSLLDVTAMAKSGGTSILLRTTTSDIVLDAGLTEAELRLSELRPGVRKWLFVSHAHGDRIGGAGVFIKDRKFVVAVGAITLELLLASLSRNADLDRILPKEFFYRVAPMWYGTSYQFTDGSSIQPIPTYRFSRIHGIPVSNSQTARRSFIPEI